MRPLPERGDFCGAEHVLREILKDGFWSAVGVYSGPSDRVVLKLYRERGWRGIPLAWIGRFMARREAALLAHVGDIEGVPRLVCAHGTTGLVHEFIEGRPLQRGELVPAEFFDRLELLVEHLHARGVAYSDLSKRDNILVGADGRPYLFDFQIAWCWPPPPGSSRTGRLLPGFVARAALRSLQEGDRHHVRKHRARHVRGGAASTWEQPVRPALPIRLMRVISRPYHKLRERRRRRA